MSADASIFQIQTRAAGPAGALPLTDELLRTSPSGDIFGLTKYVGMGWDPATVLGRQFLILSTQGGMRAADGSPVAQGYHTGHYEIGLQVEAAARELRALGTVPFAGAVSDPCDGRTQGTTGMFAPSFPKSVRERTGLGNSVSSAAAAKRSFART